MEAEMQKETRLIAIEYLIMKLFTTFYLAGDFQNDDVRKIHASWTEGMRKQPFQGLNPVQSDMVSDEIATAVERLLVGAEEMLATARS